MILQHVYLLNIILFNHLVNVQSLNVCMLCNKFDWGLNYSLVFFAGVFLFVSVLLDFSTRVFFSFLRFFFCQNVKCDPKYIACFESLKSDNMSHGIVNMYVYFNWLKSPLCLDFFFLDENGFNNDWQFNERKLVFWSAKHRNRNLMLQTIYKFLKCW